MSRWLAAFDAIRGSEGSDKRDRTDKTLETPASNPPFVCSVPFVTRPAREEQAGNVPREGTDVEERAALVESGAGVPRAWAEAFAAMDAATPTGCPFWREVVADAAMFLDRWSRQAHALDWSIDAVFGRDVLTPAAPSFQPGLVWMIRGGAVVALTKDTATVRFPATGKSPAVKQVYRYVPRHGVNAMPWDVSA